MIKKRNGIPFGEVKISSIDLLIWAENYTTGFS
jgi:hypothetical protein